MTQSGSTPSTGSVAATIVVGYTAKPEGRAALKRSIRMARAGGARIVIVHTAPERAGRPR